MHDKSAFVSQKHRSEKARKIEVVLRDALHRSELRGLKILDVGCGNGMIADHFAAGNEVVGLDVENNLSLGTQPRVTFIQLTSDNFPCESESFDVVITNHVIEHVPHQDAHLREIWRVLKATGVCYFATPNWNFPVEPHHKLPMIHYLPRPVFHKILHLLGVYKDDLRLLAYDEMTKLIRSSGFQMTEYTPKILSQPRRYHSGMTLLQGVPIRILSRLVRYSATNIFILQKLR
jgi:2-polyprenyl-3-methyl-5-hydroxy-6-metoxy-1,4-benzoquinol methylase